MKYRSVIFTMINLLKYIFIIKNNYNEIYEFYNIKKHF